jgi:hypothetical protein
VQSPQTRWHADTSCVPRLPGVRSVALCVVPPLTFDEWDSTVSVEGYSPKPGEDMQAWQNYVSPRYFETLKIPVYGGRDFSNRDALGAPRRSS